MGLLGQLGLRAAGVDLAQLFPITDEERKRRAFADEVALQTVSRRIAERTHLSFDEVLSALLRLPTAPYEHVRTPGGWALIALMFCVSDGGPLGPPLH